MNTRLGILEVLVFGGGGSCCRSPVVPQPTPSVLFRPRTATRQAFRSTRRGRQRPLSRGSRHAGSPTSTYGVLDGGGSCWRWPPRWVVGISGRRFSWSGNPAGLAALVVWSFGFGPYMLLQLNRRGASPRRTPHPVSRRQTIDTRPRIRALRPRMVVSQPTTDPTRDLRVELDQTIRYVIELIP